MSVTPEQMAKRIEELRQALIRFGSHDPDCKYIIYRKMGDFINVDCSCGLAKALEKRLTP